MKAMKLLTLLITFATTQVSVAALPENSPSGVGGIRYYNGLERADKQEVVPPGGFFFSFFFHAWPRQHFRRYQIRRW